MNLFNFKKYSLGFLILLFSAQIATAQEMKMKGHHMHNTTSAPKNIFLSMMDTMMIKMDAVPVLSYPDHDFMAQMIPHHLGAIAMAEYEIKHGKSQKMIQLAKSIAAEQTNDIRTMNFLLSQLPTNTEKPNKAFN